MYKFIATSSIIILTLFISSCNQNASKEEKDYIKNLEEKNRTLENELQAEKNKPPIIIEKPVNNYQDQEKSVIHSKDYFTIGSTEDEVIEIMGDPTNVMNIEEINRKTFSYGLSRVEFKNGKVYGYSNYGNNLKVKMKLK